MTVNGTQSANPASAASDPLSSALGGANSTLGQDSFFKLLMAQIQHQDPTKPMDDTAFVAQLAQFSSLEQQTSTNKLLELLTTQQTGLANTADISLVGKTVTVKGSSVTLSGSGLGVPTYFGLEGDAKSVSVAIQDSSGNTVRTLDVGAKPTGMVNAYWDGKGDNGNTLPAGAYKVVVTAKAADGSPIAVDQQMTGLVQTLSFTDGKATLTLDNGASATTADLISVGTTPVYPNAVANSNSVSK